MRKIPLHSLVLLVGTSRLKELEILENFKEEEIISKKIINQRIYGDPDRHVNAEIINNELSRHINLKLSLGERVVICDNNLSKNRRFYFGNIAQKYGVPVYYIIHYDNNLILDDTKKNSFLENEEDILSGDNFASVIDTRFESFKPVNKFDFSNIDIELNKRGFNGITVAGDVHGNLEGLRSSIDWAMSRNNLFIQLGDVVDYGRYSLECIEMMYDRVIRGFAINIIGNHDRKLEKWIHQEQSVRKNPDYFRYKSPVVLSEANKTTTDKINQLSYEKRIALEAKFSTLMNMGRYHLNILNCSFAHAGFLPEMHDLDSDRLYGKYESIALNGNHEEVENWVDTVKPGKFIFVGHTIKNKFLPTKQQVNDSMIIFQDTGSGKGGFLSTTDLTNENGQFRIQHHNRW